MSTHDITRRDLACIAGGAAAALMTSGSPALANFPERPLQLMLGFAQ
jgi:hypothetical protein